MAGMTALANKSSHKLGTFGGKTSCGENSLKDATEQTALVSYQKDHAVVSHAGGGEQRQFQVKIDMRITRKGKSHLS